MYTGSYFEGEAPTLPKGYDGCAFGSSEPQPTQPLEARCAPPKISPLSSPPEAEEEYETTVGEEKCESVGLLSSIFGRLPFKGFLMGTGGGGSLLGLVEKITAEEILLIGVALILFFSPDGDKLLALALLALVFIK